MVTPAEDLEFLVRSTHRMGVLKRLADSSCLRYEIHEELSVPQSTLGRILDDFQKRGWIRRDDNVYELSPLGRIIADELSSVLETIATVHKLRDCIDQLPLGQMNFDPRRLQGATVTTANNQDVNAVVSCILESIRPADTLYIVTNTATAASVEVLWESVVGGRLHLVAVFTRPLVEAIRADTDQSRQLREMLDSGRAEISCVDGTFPYVMGIRDEQYVGIVAVDERGIPVGFIQTEDESIRSWAADTIDDYCGQATPMSASMFAE